jgi:DNA mismatch endonuclease, patch repair protein
MCLPFGDDRKQFQWLIMPDVFNKAKRSEVMSHIRSRGNKDTEVALAKLLRRHKITGWRRHLEIRKAKSGKLKFKVRPDFVFPKLKLALFVDGCFWHGCPKHETKPKNNRAFWRKKLSSNKKRDRLVTRTLQSAKWRVLRIWEHDLHRATRRQATKKRGHSTPHPGPLPVRGGEGEERLLRRIQRALDFRR